MCKDLVCLSNVSKLSEILTAISTKHHAFPVLNSKGNFVGLIPRNFLLILLQERHFYGSNIDSMTEKEEYTSSKVMQSQVSDTLNSYILKTHKSPSGERRTQGGFTKLVYKRDSTDEYKEQV